MHDETRRGRVEGRQIEEEKILEQYHNLIKNRVSYYWEKIKDFGTVIEKKDLIQVASLAVVQAHREYDPERGTNFLNFAWKRISYALKDYLHDHARTIQISDYALEKLEEEENTNPTPATIAAYKWKHPTTTTRVGDEITDILNNIAVSEDPDDIALNPEIILIMKEDQELLKKIFDRANLSFQEANIIKQIYGLNHDEEPISMKDIAQLLGTTYGIVRGLKDRALKKLQEAHRNIQHDDEVGLLT